MLAAPTKDTNSVQLAWTIAGSFASYRIYRAVGSATPAVVDMLNAPAALAYRDDKITLGATYSYQVGGLTAAGQEVRSNVQTITTGVFISVNSQVERMMIDPRRPYLYAVDKVNNSLHFINLTTKTLDKTIFIGSTPTDLSINLAGTELFVATFGATEIAVVNLETREKARSLIVDVSKGTWQGNPYRLVCTAGDTVVYTSDDQWNDLKLVSAATGAYVATAGSIYYPALATSPDGTRVYVGESGSTGTAVIRFDVVGSTLKMMDSSTTLGFGSRQVNCRGTGCTCSTRARSTSRTTSSPCSGHSPRRSSSATAMARSRSGRRRSTTAPRSPPSSRCPCRRRSWRSAPTTRRCTSTT